MTMTLLIAALFAAGAGFAVATISATLRAYWPAVCALRQAANYLPEENELRVTTISLEVTRAAQVLRGEFRRPDLAASGALRAAA